MRKAIVESVFGQIKDAMGFRRFSFRGINSARAEWDLVCAMLEAVSDSRSQP
jgi:hypothetical protein